MARSFGSWLSGPQAPQPDSGAGPTHPGKRLGLPETGPGSIAGFGRRAGALLVDWLIAYGIAALVSTAGWVPSNALSTAILAVWFVLGVLPLRLFGFTPGQLVCGIGVVALDAPASDGRVGLGRAAARGVLTALVVPVLFTDADQRGLQDRVSGTAVLVR